MADVTVSVSSRISVNLRVLRWLKSMGADVEEYLEYILIYTTGPRSSRFLWWTFVTPGRLQIGELNLTDREHGADPSKNWIIKAYGQAYLREVTQWAEKLSAQFKVKVHVTLMTENPLDPRDNVEWD